MGLDFHSGEYFCNSEQTIRVAEPFILQEGLFSVLFGISSFFLLPNSPKAVKTLNDEERELISRALLLDGISEMGKASENRSWSEFRRTFVQPHVILLVIVGFFSGQSLQSSFDSLYIC